MTGRIVAGREHSQECDFPWKSCVCTDDPIQLINSIKNKMFELELLVNKLERKIND